MARNRSGTDSRCCDPSLKPLAWLDYVDAEHFSVIEFDDWIGSLTRVARAHEEGEIEDLFEAAGHGELQDSGDARTKIKPIRKDPEVYELRRKALAKNLRFYHGEPKELPKGLVKLHRHIKVDASTQASEIEYAAQRYKDGRASLWM